MVDWHSVELEFERREIERVRKQRDELKETLAAVGFDMRRSSSGSVTLICRWCKQSIYSPMPTVYPHEIKHKPDCKIAKLLGFASHVTTEPNKE